MQQTLQPTSLDSLADLDVPVGPDQLIELTAALASRPRLWRRLVRHDPETRWYERLLLTDAVEVWLIGWVAGQSTSVHDHGGAAGALTVVEGALDEEEFDPELRLLRRGLHRAGASAGFAPAHVHRIFNQSPANATSLHAYSPPGQQMREYVVAGLEELDQ
jgi:predicted metal-dependent enzyme (double-stranded beta helix superfamily)